MSEEMMNNYYGFDENTGEDQILDMPAGINENVSLMEVKFEKPKEDSKQKAIIMIFENDKGEQFAHFEFPINTEVLKEMAPSWNRKPEDLISEQFSQQGARLKHICAAFTSKNLALKASTWEEFGEKLIEFIGKEYTGKKFRIKIVYGNKDRLQFPRRPIRPFIQNMEEPNTLRISPKWDHIRPQSKPASENEFEDEFEDNNESTASDTPAKAKAELVDDDDF